MKFKKIYVVIIPFFASSTLQRHLGLSSAFTNVIKGKFLFVIRDFSNKVKNENKVESLLMK